jgi:hypothetical protein
MNLKEKEYKLIFLCSRPKVKDIDRDKLLKLIKSGIDWERVIKISAKQEVLSLLHWHLKNYADIIGGGILATFEEIYYDNLIDNLEIEKEILPVLKSAAQKNIETIAFKGFGLIYSLYHNPGLRWVVDVDLLIEKNQLPSLREIISDLGFRESPTDIKGSEIYSNQACFIKRGSSGRLIICDLHWKFSLARPNELILKEARKRIIKEKVDNLNISCLSHEDSVIVTAVHVRKHLRELKLKSIVDIAWILADDKTKLDLNYIKSEAKKNGIESSLYLVLYLAKNLLGAEIPAEVMIELKPNILVCFLISFILRGSNICKLSIWRAVILRVLLFDNLRNMWLYFWRVLVIEKTLLKHGVFKNE